MVTIQSKALAKKLVYLKAAHVSLQFNLVGKKKRRDANKIFRTAKEKGVWWVTGTEAREKSGRKALRAAADRHGFFLNNPKGEDAWVAINKDFVDGGYEKHYSGVLVRGAGLGFGNKGVVISKFYNKEANRIFHVAALHRPLKARRPGDVNYKRSLKLVDYLTTYAKENAKGTDSMFVGEDGNVNNKFLDPYFGRPWNTCWDETKKYPDTGHGTIDYIASYKNDKKIRCVGTMVRNDKRLKLFTDHFWIQAQYLIKE